MHPNIFGNDPNLGTNFRIKWIKICKLDASLTDSFRNPFDGNIRIRMSKDSQELETAAAEKLCELMMQQPDYHNFDIRKKRKKSEDKTDKLIIKKQKTNKE